MYVCMYACQLTCSISQAVKCIRSIRRWAYEVFGNEHAIEVRCAAVLYCMVQIELSAFHIVLKCNIPDDYSYMLL